MDIARLSIIMSQSRVQEATSLAVMKMSMSTGKQIANQTTEMIKNIAVDINVGQNLDVKV